MLNSVKAWVNLHNWQLERQLTLLAVSGGSDSVAMFHAFLELKLPFIVAHVNFGLRGDESDDDELFVTNLCTQNGISCFVHRVDVHHWKSVSSNSIQMEARAIRYEFFEKIRIEHHANFIATAHHSQDNLENFFIYLFRDNLESAWKGISAQNGNVIRPLLSTPKKEISEFLSAKNAAFRIDSSNHSNKYLRNKVRHAIIEHLEDLETIQRDFLKINAEFSNIQQMKNNAFDSKWKSNTVEDISDNVLTLSKIGWESKDKLFLTKKLFNYGFTERQVSDAFFKAHKNGSFWEGKSHYVLYQQNEQELILCSKSPKINPVEISMNQLPVEIIYGNFRIHISMSHQAFGEDLKLGVFEFAINSNEPMILKFRPYLAGDKIQLFGMKGRKMVSDLLNENKIPSVLKNQYPVIELNGLLIGIVSVRKAHFVADNANSYLRIDWKLTTQTD